MRASPKTHPLRVALLQLPLQEGDSFYTNANVPLAAGYLTAYQKVYAPHLADIVIPDPVLLNQAGDAALLQWILRGDFDVVGFTLYLWNRDRSVYLARQIRQKLPECILVAGGPEVANPKGLDAFHALFEGEGEETFLKFLQNVRDDPNPCRLSEVYPRQSFPLRFTQEKPLPLDTVPNPYLEGVLPVGPGEPLYLETLRGCPRRCSYCFYGKAYPFVRQFPSDRLSLLFRLASERAAPEIYLMDPSFNIGGTKELEARVRLLEEVNPARIPLHTELVLESVTRDLARGMRRAGFRSVEVGLQTTNRKALRAVRRPLDPNRFQRGARYLQEEGIEVRTGVILGLPEDDLDGFRRTLDFIEKLNLQDHLEVYLLSLLPGTELREQADNWGILYMEHPPYWVLATPSFPAEHLYVAIAELEDRYGIEYQRPILPSFSNTGPFLTYIDLRKEAEQSRLLQTPHQISWNLTLSISSTQLGDPTHRGRLLELARHLFRTNPYAYFKIVIHDEAPDTHAISSPSLRNAWEELASSLFLPTHYGNLSRTYIQDPQGRFTVRLFLQTKDPKTRRIVERQGDLEILDL